MGNDFFQVISVSEFLARLRRFSPVSRIEEIGLSQASGRTMAEDLVAEEDLPPFHRSSMDGYAVRAADTFGAGEFQPVYLEAKEAIHVGELPGFQLKPGQCAPIVTGAALPEGADAVVMIEHTADLGGDIEVQRSLAPGENVLLQGEDCRRSEVQLRSGTQLAPQQLGLLAALGQSVVTVFEKPRAAIISTGDEIVPVETNPPPGCIRDVNSAALSAWIRSTGGEVTSYGLVPDDAAVLRGRLLQALKETDLVLISGGSSVGSRDVTLEVLEGLSPGGILAHGVAISPGKPTILADVQGKPVFGLPGQVTSAQVVYFALGQPFIRYLSGQTESYPDYIRPSLAARLSRNLPSALGRDDYVRVKLIPDRSFGYLAEPLLGKSGLLKSLIQADGLTCVPAETEGFDQGQLVDVWLV